MAGVARAPGTGLTDRIDRLAAMRPDIVFTAPLMTYLLMLGVTVALPVTWQPVTIALRGVLSLVVVWLLRRHLPPWGKPHWVIAIVGGVVVAWGWIVGQYACDWLGVPGRLPVYPGDKVVTDPRGVLGAGNLFWTTWWLRMLVAVVSVPVVEEIFWRGFLLRAMIDWQHFERIKLGTFTWSSFLGTALISTLQHPDNWVVSIFCWLVFNAVFYWTRRIRCRVLLPGRTAADSSSPGWGRHSARHSYRGSPRRSRRFSRRFRLRRRKICSGRASRRSVPPHRRRRLTRIGSSPRNSAGRRCAVACNSI